RNRLAAARTAGNGPLSLVTGFGDLVVLVNPAVESAAFEAVSEATRQARFSAAQAPVMLVVSSENDRATGSWFPLGRWFGVLNEVHRGDEHRQNTRAIGWYKPQVTHCLSGNGGAPCAGTTVPTRTPRGPQLTFSSQPRAQEDYAGVWIQSDVMHPESIELAADIGMVATNFYRLDPKSDPNLPFVVARTTREIVDGHNDMFSHAFVDFLMRYVAGTELKRFAFRARARAAEKPQ
ncbi:MAG: hypothetical protein ABI837_16905, partial [Acidobacteriota bacterium]